MNAQIRNGVTWTLVIIVLLSFWSHGAYTEFAAELERVKARGEVHVNAWKAESSRADSLQKSLVLHAARNTAQSDSIARLQQRIRERRPVLAAVPDTCRPIVSQLLADHDSLDAGLTTARAIITRQQAAIASLNLTIDKLQVRGDSLAAVIVSIPHPAKPPSRFGIGAFGGQCLGAFGATPCVGLGVYLRAL